MFKILTIVTLTIFYNLVNSEDNVKRSDIEELERENKRLLKEIDVAVRDSLDSLKQANKSDAVNIGIEMMKNISQELNLSTNNNKMDKNLKGGRTDDVDARRHSLHKNSKIKLTMSELQALFKKDVISEHQLLDPETEQTKTRVEQWLQQKKIENQRIRDYKEKQRHKLLSLNNEKCPRLGLGKKMVKKGDKRRKPYYPCCRKCCKKSYMGCL